MNRKKTSAMYNTERKKQGFTLAELLIVVAIIGVLVAVSIPIFTTKLEFSKEEVDIANMRSAYAVAQVGYMCDDYKEGDTLFYNRSTLTSSAPEAYGQGTSGDGGASVEDLPWAVYDNGSDVRESYIAVDFLANKEIRVYWVGASGGSGGSGGGGGGSQGQTASYNPESYNDTTDYDTYPSKAGGTPVNTNFASAVMKGQAYWLQSLLREKNGDNSIVVKATNANPAKSDFGKSLSDTFNKDTNGSTSDFVYTVTGEKGTTQYYYIKTSATTVKLVATREVTSDMKDENGSPINEPITTDNRYGWTAYTGA